MDLHLRIAQYLAKLLDSEFKILGFKIGLDPLIGLIPWIGDLISLVFSAYIIWIAFMARVPQNVIAKMIRNVIFDFLLGLIPVVGDVSDFFYRANKKNLDLLLRHKNPVILEGKVI